MPPIPPLTGVPVSKVGTIVNAFIKNEKATQVTATQEPGQNTWKVAASK